MRALVTGAAGFVGRYLVQHLADLGDQVLATDHSISVTIPARTGVRWQQLDVSDASACSDIISQFEPEIIYHLAGIAFVPEAENNFDRALVINVGGTNNLIRAVHLLQLGSTVVLISSAEVYGRIKPEDLPLQENTRLNPANNYSLSKSMAEMVAARYGQFGYVRTVVMRPFNHVGPGQDSRFVVSSFANQLAKIRAGKSPPIIRVGNLEAKRDFSDVEDIVRAYRLAAQQGQGTYNLCSGQPVSIQWILNTLIEISGLTVEIEQDPARMRPSEVPVLYGSFEKAKRELGWQPNISLTETLRKTYMACLEQVS